MSSDHDRLYGRVVALDLIVRGIMTNVLFQSRDQISSVERLRQDLLDSLQRLAWPGNVSSEILDGAVTAVNEHFDGVAERLRNRMPTT